MLLKNFSCFPSPLRALEDSDQARYILPRLILYTKPGFYSRMVYLISKYKAGPPPGTAYIKAAVAHFVRQNQFQGMRVFGLFLEAVLSIRIPMTYLNY